MKLIKPGKETHRCVKPNADLFAPGSIIECEKCGRRFRSYQYIDTTHNYWSRPFVDYFRWHRESEPR